MELFYSFINSWFYDGQMGIRLIFSLPFSFSNLLKSILNNQFCKCDATYDAEIESKAHVSNMTFQQLKIKHLSVAIGIDLN
jgi:hypothetical protein